VRATNWEFKNRALVFGLIFGLSFSLYFPDQQNSAAALANWLGAARAGWTRISWLGSCLLSPPACSSPPLSSVRGLRPNLHSSVVYAAEVKTASLVADGPYRRVRIPLYFANIPLAIRMGAMMSRTGCFVAIAAMLVFCYRLILGAESELQASQGQPYDLYRKAVPRLWPSPLPRTTSASPFRLPRSP
jgi:hypothetical protein